MTEPTPETGSKQPQPVAQLASLGPNWNSSSDGTAIRFSLTGSGFKLLKGVTSGPDWISDQEGGDFRYMHLSLKPVLLAAGGRAPTAATAWRYSFYNPEMNLLSETELRTTTGTPLVLYEYIWFNGHPVAQVEPGPVTRWTFTDHLGTPIIQTDSAGNTYWRAEYEPYGQVFALRSPDQHQPLRLPGQEAEQLNLGPNGTTERSYNIFRWYKPGWGRYTQADPLSFLDPPDIGRLQAFRRLSPYLYVDANPLRLREILGLCTSCDPCPSGNWKLDMTAGVSGGAGFGGSKGRGRLICHNPNDLVHEYVTRPVDVECWWGGPMLAVGVGGDVQFRGYAVTGTCRPEKLHSFGFTNSFGSFGPISVTGDPSGFGIGISVFDWGAGFARQECWVRPR